MAPSPTGELHIGGLRTALYDYALARQTSGRFILRIEDTDQKREVAGAADRIQQVLKDYGLVYDEGPFFQSQRLDIYRQHLQPLIDQGLAYYCFCDANRLTELRTLQKAQKKLPRYDRHCLNLSKEEITQKLANHEPYVVRLKVPDRETIVFDDLVRGRIKFSTSDVDDQVLLKSDGVPTYHFASVVDDHLMAITHVFRGEEWLPSVPKHLLLYRYLGWEPPKFAHLSLFLDPSHSGKMSKRFGSVSAQAFLDDGYLPQAMLNFLMLLGWNPGTPKEIYSLDEFIADFSIEKLNKKPAVFDRKKLDYLNGHYLRQQSDSQLLSLLQPFVPQITPPVVALIKERLATLKEAVALTNFFYEDVDYPADLLLQRGATKDLAIDMLTQTRQLLADFSDLQNRLLGLIKKNNWTTGQYFMVLRVAICGAAATPPIVESLPILGQSRVLSRLSTALSKLQS